jgi:DNA polymerase-3 subunit epsilon
VYAVIDLETTGLRTDWHDRVVEIAIVRLDGAGRIEDEWCSLVNPVRDLGPQHIHGISAAEARRAPTFAQLAGEVTGLLRGRLIAAHNLAFDSQFLVAEYRRSGFDLRLDLADGLCTMQLAASFLPTAGRSLYSCCRTAGVTLEHAHSARYDARAAAHLLAYYLAVAGQPPPWAPLLAAATAARWPQVAPQEVVPVDRRRDEPPADHFLSRLVERLPRLYQPDADAYLDLLDRVLLERQISPPDAAALVSVAGTLGLGRGDALTLHRQYLQALATVAVADGGVATARQRADLVGAAGLLGLDERHVDQALVVASRTGGPAVFALAAGDAVVFTGQTKEPREVWEARAAAAGLVVADRVTRNTRVLVAADLDTMSEKARTAHRYGIPVIHPAVFLQLIA